MKKPKLLFCLMAALWIVLNGFVPDCVNAQDCSSGFYQMKEGATFALTTFSPKDKVLAKSVHTYQKINQSANGFSAQMNQELFDDKGQQMSKNSYELICQEGVIKLNIQDLMGAGMAMQNASIKMEFSGDALELPSNLSVGQTLKEATFTIKGTMGEMKIMDRTVKMKERKVESKETLDTPAGKFECFKIVSMMESTGMMGKSHTTKSVSWYAKGPGLVKTESYDEKGRLTGYSLLTAYSK